MVDVVRDVPVGVHCTDEAWDETFIRLVTNSRTLRTAVGQGTASDSTIDSICMCVSSVLFIVLCSAFFFEPDDLIFSATSTTKMTMAKKKATTMNATEPPDPVHLEHTPELPTPTGA
jgi:hypothetical protein